MSQTKSGREITYNGRAFAKTIKRASDSFQAVNTIDELFELLLNTWRRETAYPNCQSDYIYEEDPTYGQCAITAMLVHDIFGGTIHKIRVDGGGTHYFNKINGHYIDLTSDQFTLYNLPLEYEPNEEIPREYCGKNTDTLKRYNLLLDLLNTQVQNKQAML